jgi:type III restriction enzyme
VEDHDRALRGLEQLDFVRAYAKNDRLDFEIDYRHQDKPHRYRPDFLVRVTLADGSEATLIVELKGFEDEQDRAKHAMAQKWVRAVDHHGGFGYWDHLVCKDPNELPRQLETWREEQGSGPRSRAPRSVRGSRPR